MEPNYREAVKRVQDGDIGTIIGGEALYVCGPTVEAGPSSCEPGGWTVRFQVT